MATRLGADGQVLDIRKEKFALYVPPRKPPQGYALLVFVPPWNKAHVPENWISVFDPLGVIFVSAANSGNDANVKLRRVPLALIAPIMWRSSMMSIRRAYSSVDFPAGRAWRCGWRWPIPTSSAARF